ncbi:MAG: hypothetical protein EOO50_05595 [Flavobacterium sp.]|uniref:hypothetical protein n=1 Tax=Flavobacterium sp. TaxID=239 RepID=UPI00120139F9|nr:hypothetical protein [Flavobacterium sp.]RZJ67461.1 MAG: hypothetical protein EOO50_05595 [Flavobacterium sp.]
METKDQITRNISLAALVVFGSAIFYSCSSDENGTSASSQEKDAVDAITYSLQSDSNGLAKSVESASMYAADENLYARAVTLECGVPYSASYDEAWEGTNYSYDYSISRNTELSCTAEDTPSSLSYNASHDGVYDTPRMSSDDAAALQWTLAGLDATSQNATLDGSYVRNGSQVSKVREQNTFKSTLTYDLTAINVSKTNHQIVSGSASVAFAGVSSNGNSYNYNGTITFNGNGTATLVINGNTYTINL